MAVLGACWLRVVEVAANANDRRFRADLTHLTTVIFNTVTIVFWYVLAWILGGIAAYAGSCLRIVEASP